MAHKIFESTTHDYDPVNKYIDENQFKILKFVFIFPFQQTILKFIFRLMNLYYNIM